jgi:SepF-like predicted cell division protein (DUF552 family)
LPRLGKKIEKLFGKSAKAGKAEEPKKEPEAVSKAPVSPAPSPLHALTPSLPPKVYFKAMPLRELEDLDVIKREVESGNILVIRVTPLAKKSIEDVKRAVDELSEFVRSVEGDIARLGEERVVVTPSFVRIWRRSTTSEAEVPTAA